MTGPRDPEPMRIRLSREQREVIVRSIRLFFDEELDREVSRFQAEALLDFFVRELGAPVYNQAIRDAQAFVQDKMLDLSGELYEPEEPYAEDARGGGGDA
jgi:uncharacterized protein (DUF2164 family)